MPEDERTSAKSSPEPALAIVLPALDEEAAVGDQVRALRAHPAFQALLPARIIVVDNGSRDRTAEVACAAGAEVVREPRRGYGYACLAGVRAATGANVVLLMDADGSDDLDGAARVARLVLAGAADLAMGARRVDRHELTLTAHRGVHRTPGVLTPQQRAGNAIGALALRLLYGARVSDIAPLRAIRREALLALDPREMAYGWSTEMLAKGALAGLRIVELPVAAHPRAGGKSKVAGTLRGTLGASIHILRTLWRYRRWQPEDGQSAVEIARERQATAGGPAVKTAPKGLPATTRRPAVETAPGGPTAAKSACADWEQSGRANSGRALFVMARLPVAGQTKTRLGRAIGHEAAALLYRAFLRDLSVRLGAAAAADGYDLYWYYAAPEEASETEFAACIAPEGEDGLVFSVLPSPAPPLSSLVSSRPTECSSEARLASGVGGEGLNRVRLLRQPEGDFAARLWYGFEQLAARSYWRVVVLGSDSPQVPVAQVVAAFAALETHDIALGPARDGGYYLLGQRGRPTDLFTGIQMSTPRVAAETLARAAALGLSVAMLPESFDVDEPADLDALAHALADAPSAAADPAPATRAALAMIRAAATAAEKASAATALPAAPALGNRSASSLPVEGAVHGAA